MNASTGIETKVAAQGSVALAVGYLAQIVLTIISQHTSIVIDDTLANEITVFCTVVAGWVAGYYAPHTHRLDVPVVPAAPTRKVQSVPLPPDVPHA